MALRTARVARAAISPTFRTAARSIRPIELSRSTDARVVAVTTLATLRPEIFLVAGFAALTATARVTRFATGFFLLTAFGAALRVFGAAFFIFFLGLAIDGFS